jgi:hypothetical protein
MYTAKRLIMPSSSVLSKTGCKKTKRKKRMDVLLSKIDDALVF